MMSTTDLIKSLQDTAEELKRRLFSFPAVEEGVNAALEEFLWHTGELLVDALDDLEIAEQIARKGT